MITCNLHGRLGNNLFQIATLISIAKRANVDFILPSTTHAGHRGDIYADFSMFGYNFKRGKYETNVIYNEKDFSYSPNYPVHDNLKISGFFQSWKYFEDIKDLLISTYFSPSQQVSTSLSKYNVSPNSLGISVRRGDYLMLQQNHCVLSAKYYQDVLDKHFNNNIDRIYKFSDDISWCKGIFGGDVNYVEDSIGVQLFLMARMKHLIMSNSTFAWWGAYLNQNNGIIVAPNPWFGPAYADKDTKDLYYPSWVVENHNIEVQTYSLTPNMFN